ncbi:MAG: hypothetical protein BWY92_01958 [Firmicutes bacterium ADurb.BinA052]|nr:MAG: hypothetical protein BWY92_01958 [Firmicutes bacterium ADurb.BinA052]
MAATAIPARSRLFIWPAIICSPIDSDKNGKPVRYTRSIALTPSRLRATMRRASSSVAPALDEFTVESTITCILACVSSRLSI